MPQRRLRLLKVMCKPYETRASLPLEPSASRGIRPWKLDAALKCRSCRTPRYYPLMHMIKLTREREIAPYVWGMSLGSRSVYRERSVVWFARQPKPRVEFRYLATEDPMATQIVMDRSGDTRHNFDAKNADALLKAEERFRELTGAGFTAAVRTASGEAVVKRSFDPNAEETLFFPQLVGG
jgi:hypothetical protein